MIKPILFYLTIVSFTAFLVTGCSNNHSEETVKTNKDSISTFDMTATRKIIDEKNHEFEKAFVGGDSATLVHHYTSDAKLFPPNADAVTGSDAIAKIISQYLKYGIKEFKDETTALYGDEKNLIEEGKLFMGDGKGNTIENGKYICVWRKDNNEWKVYSNMWNTSLTAPTAK